MTTENMSLRRSDRLLSEERALLAAASCGFAVLCTADTEGIPYGVPVNTVFFNGKFYFHGSSFEGRRSKNMLSNPRVSLTFVPFEAVDAEAFSTDYVSVIIEGEAAKVEDTEEKKAALSAIASRFRPGLPEEPAVAYIEGAFDAVTVWSVSVDRFCGKSRNPNRYFG